MAITFNDKLANVTKIRHYVSDGGAMVYRGSGSDLVDLFDDGDAAGAFLTFGQNYNLYSKYNGISFTISTALVADSISIVWEYCRRGSGNYDETWHALSNVVDNTKGFTQSGEVTWDVPEDWENYLDVQGNGDFYYWVVRARIDSVTNLAEGGATSKTQARPYYIYVDSGDDTTPTTFDDIYNEDVTNGWGVVAKDNQFFTFNCVLQLDEGYVLKTQQEVIQFLENWDIWIYGKIISGKVYSGSKVYDGSTFIFNIYNADIKGILAHDNAEIYNTQYRHIVMPGAARARGHWGGSLGSRPGQKIYDIYAEGMRQFDFVESTNVIIGARGYGLNIEHPGAILKNITCYGGRSSVRPGRGNRGTYMHTSDFSGAILDPINPYMATIYDLFEMDFVDCNWGEFEDSHKAYWYISTSYDYYQGCIWETYSLLLKIIDKNNSAILGSAISLKDKNGTEVFNGIANADGYPGQDSGIASSATVSTLTDNSKSWADDEWHFQEVYITSGTGAGQRRIIKKGNTATEIQVAPDWDVTPDTTSKYIIIPYVRVKKMASPANKPSSSGNYWSIATDYNPFVLTISKPGYQTYQEEITIDKKINWMIALERSKISVDQEVLI